MSSPEKKNLSENNGLIEKLLLTSLGAWLVDKQVDTKIRGSKNEVKVISNALLASTQLREELGRAEATLDSVAEKIRIQLAAKAEFKRVFGISWPL